MSTRAAPAVPGPVQREAFDDAQRRHRRAARRLTGLTAAIVAVMGVPLSVAITPVLYLVAVLTTDLVNLVVRVPDLLPLATKSGEQVRYTHGQVVAIVSAAIPLAVIPGAIVLFAAWLAVRRLLRADPVAVARRGGARPPRRGDLEERQLVDIAAEVALAAGVSPPGVLLLDGGWLGARVVGASHEHTTLVVGRATLDTLTREATQGLVADLLAAAGNGDLRVAATFTALDRTLGLVSAVLGAPFDAGARRSLRRVLRRDGDPAAILDDLAEHPTSSDNGRTGGFRSFLALPFVGAAMSFGMTQLMVMSMVVRPLERRIRRRRRLLADATSVELTRFPDGLARALVAVAGDAPPAVGSHLELLGDADTAARVERLVAMGADIPVPPTRRRPKGCVYAVLAPLAVVFAAIMLALTAAMFVLGFVITGLGFGMVIVPLHMVLRYALA